jgi:hypothetical protein
MRSKKSADTRSNTSNPSSRCLSAVRQASPSGVYSAFTSVTSRVSDDLASPKSIEVLGA